MFYAQRDPPPYNAGGLKPVWLIDSVNMEMIMSGGDIPAIWSEVTTMRLKEGPLRVDLAADFVVRRWVVEKVQETDNAAFVFMTEIKESDVIMTGSSLVAKLLQTDGEEITLGPYVIPHDSACFTDNIGREMGEDIMHALARQDPLPIIKISVVKR